MNRNLDIVQRIVDSPRTIPALVILYVLVSLTACTGVDRAALGIEPISSADVTCYSGGQVIYKSFGTVVARSGPDGWDVQEAGTGKFVRASGDCVLRY